jgi:nicotinate (nicotinamide) nucleotide adenylyltransferase
MEAPPLCLIYGLSANPVHQGHIDLMAQAFAALRRLGKSIRKAIFVPVYRRNPVGPQKEGLPKTYEHRFAMCQLAAEIVAERLEVAKNRVAVSRVEARLAQDRESPNYTAETLRALQRTFKGQCELAFLISSELVSGGDPEFGRWHQVDLILERATLVICPRPDYPPNLDFVQSLRDRGGRLFWLRDVRTTEVSATELRVRLAHGEDPRTLVDEGLLPPAIADYLQRHPIYL